MRHRLVTAAAVVVAAVFAGCTVDGGSPATPTPTPASRDVASAYRCLADHSPWSIDLDAVHAEWSDAADDAAHPVSGGDVTGTATVSFTRGEQPTWQFDATGVDYELYFADGTREKTVLDVDSTGRYVIPEPGDLLELSRVQVATSSEQFSTTVQDGTTTANVTVASPRFPWLVGSTVAFTCTEHRLVLSTPGQVPASWTLLPGA